MHEVSHNAIMSDRYRNSKGKVDELKNDYVRFIANTLSVFNLRNFRNIGLGKIAE